MTRKLYPGIPAHGTDSLEELCGGQIVVNGKNTTCWILMGDRYEVLAQRWSGPATNREKWIREAVKKRIETNESQILRALADLQSAEKKLAGLRLVEDDIVNFTGVK